MKKTIAVLVVLLVAGCSSMGIGGSSMATSGHSNMGSMHSPGSMDREPVIKSNGNLSLHHGG